MKQFMLVACLALFSLNLSAQHATVVYNYERNYFNENQPLPAETNFVLTGSLDENVGIVETEIFRAGDKKKIKPLYSAIWKRPYGKTTDVFSVPMNYKLRGGAEYDFRVKYFRNLSDAEREYLRIQLFKTLDAYTLSSLEVNKNGISLLKPYRHIMHDLNTIVSDALAVYRSRAEIGFDGFSDVVKGKLQQIEDADLNKGRFIFPQKKKNAKAQYANRLLEDLLQVIRNEAEQYLNSDLMLLSDTKTIDDYGVEKAKGGLSINGGYGGVHFDGGFDDFDYDSAPYIGVSFPFGRAAFSRFLGNASISAGVFLFNFENEAGEEITGPVIKRPYYVGLGYKLFKFIRLNAGASFTEKTNSSGDNEVRVRPFVGISAEVNLSLKFGDK